MKLRVTQEGLVYTSQKVLHQELAIVEKAQALSQKHSFAVAPKSIKKHLDLFDQRSKASGFSGLSPDQRLAIEHMVSAQALSAVVGYAGTGKTYAVECARDIWFEAGYQVVGLAPTGKAADNLAPIIPAMTVHKFLQDYETGRNHFNAKTILVLDEAGMVDLTRCEALLAAVDKLGVKLVTLGDGRQLQSVGAGTAFRLVTQQSGMAHLETVIRQQHAWMREATQHFGRGNPEAAIQLYQDQGRIHLVTEQLPNVGALLERQDWQGLVEAYNRSVRHQKLSGWTLRSEIGDESKSMGKALIKQWQAVERQAATAILDHAQECKGYIREMGTDPYRLAGHRVTEQERNLRKQQIIALAKKHDLYVSAADFPETWEHRCQVRQTTITRLVRDWYDDRKAAEHRDKHVMFAFTNADIFALNQQARQKLQQDGTLDSQEFIHTTVRLDENDFGEEIKTMGTRAFAKGDRIQFMKNEGGLGVKNGMLGTVVKVDKHKLEVRLDTKKTVSFATKLYPYVDHAYAITVHKSQGMTGFKSYVLATNHFIRNLAYVVFTRHTEDIKVYYANVEAWTANIARKQLSKSGEKLSSLDYLDVDKLVSLVKQESHILTQAYRKVSNHLNAAAYVAKRGFSRLLGYEAGYAREKVCDSPLTEAQRGKLLAQERMEQQQNIKQRGVELEL